MQKLRFITIEELLEMMENGEEFKLVDVLTEESYKGGHIPNAINIPLNSLDALAPKHLDKADTIVVYCSDYTCHASTDATRKLLEMGYGKAVDFKAGKKGWRHAGFELET